VLASIRSDETECQFALSHRLEIFEKGQVDAPALSGLVCDQWRMLEEKLDALGPNCYRHPATVLVVFLLGCFAGRRLVPARDHARRED
jgi:hypothetical protein